MAAPFDADRARRWAQRTRDHPATPDSRAVFGYTLDPERDVPRCATCGDRIRYVMGVPVTTGGAGLRYILGGPPDYHRRGHWRHYPEVRVLCDCGHDPDDHDMRAAPPRCQHAGCACGEEATDG